MRDDDPPDPKVVSFQEAKEQLESRTPEVTITNQRRYSVDQCRHRGPYVVDYALSTVECQDCGALLNPMFVLERLAYGEAYWNQRRKDLTKYLTELEKEIAGRQRTRCTHCGNMTAIRLEARPPQTWVTDPAMNR
jgi:ribosomal protein S27E